jgi:hypothetical protein
MQLMDRSSLGRDYNAFKSLYTRIERALQFVVNGIDVDWGNLTDERSFSGIQQLNWTV